MLQALAQWQDIPLIKGAEDAGGGHGKATEKEDAGGGHGKAAGKEGE